MVIFHLMRLCRYSMVKKCVELHAALNAISIDCGTHSVMVKRSIKKIVKTNEWTTKTQTNRKKNTHTEKTIRIGMRIIILISFFYIFGFLFDSCFVWNTLWRFAQLSNKNVKFQKWLKFKITQQHNTCYGIQMKIRKNGDMFETKRKIGNMEPPATSFDDKRSRTYMIARQRYGLTGMLSVHSYSHIAYDTIENVFILEWTLLLNLSVLAMWHSLFFSYSVKHKHK